jgi:diguanylate cyclase (GGDEF)-like protein
MVSLTERIGYLQALRVGFAATVLGSTLFAREVVGRSITDVVLVSAVYLAVGATVEALRRAGKFRALPLVGSMLLADGVYLAWVLYATGGTQSPLRFLIYIHLIAVTLLASYRTGLKIALWHSLLFFVVFYAQAADIIEPNEAAAALTPNSPEFVRASVFNIMAFWLVAIGTALFSALNERELRRRKVDFEDLAAMAASLEDEDTPDGVARVLLDRVCDSFGFKRGVVLGEAEHGAPVLAYRGPGDGETLFEGVDPVVDKVWAERKTVLLKQFDEADKRLASLLPFARNLVIAPLVADRYSVGVIVLEHPRTSGLQIQRRIVQMVAQFAAHGALALRNAHLLEEIKRMADTDGLTGLANRRSFQKTLEREMSRAARNGESVTLLMADVDHFKRFNDEHGHQAGDEALRLVAEALVAACRDFDLPARYGGEEFAVILPACSSAESLRVGERLREAMSSIDALEGITASAGVATFPTHASDHDGLIRAADEALYESKRSGRGRLSRSKRRGKSPSRSSEPGNQEQTSA